MRAFFRFSAPLPPPVAALLTAFVVAAAAAGTAAVVPATFESAVPSGAGEVSRSLPIGFSLDKDEFDDESVHVFGVDA